MSALSEHYAGKECPDDCSEYNGNVEYIRGIRIHVDEGGQLSHQNGLHLLKEVERLQGLVPRYLGGTRGIEEAAKAMVRLGQEHRAAGKPMPTRLQEAEAALIAAEKARAGDQ